MEPLECTMCGACVEVRKSTWSQTSVQWHADAMEACVERRAAVNPQAFPGCGALSQSIREAAVLGKVHIVDEILSLHEEGARQ